MPTLTISLYRVVLLPLLVFLSFPLAIFATFTSILAFTILAIRVLIVYAELAIAVLPYYIFGVPYEKQASISRIHSFGPGNFTTTSNPSRRRRRRASNSSAVSTTSLTPVSSTLGLSLGLPLTTPYSTTRDFEGVGGWRLASPNDDENREDELWTSMNSRLELPADHIRRHKRSLTGGSIPVLSQHNAYSPNELRGQRERGNNARSYSPELEMAMSRRNRMAGGESPNTSRARTPPAVANTIEGYFPPQVSPKSKRNSGSTASSVSSKGSGGGLSKIKHV